jgi:hypothetical protein
MVNCFQKCKFHLNEANDGEDQVALGITKDDWGQQKTGISFQEHVSCDQNILIWGADIRTKDGSNFTFGVSPDEEYNNRRKRSSSWKY